MYAAAAIAPDQAGSSDGQVSSGDPTRPPEGCSDPARWLDAYLIAEAHRAERGVCRCGRPLPCIASERAAEIMAETMQAAREAETAAAAARAFSEAITQELPVIRLEAPVSPQAPVGARFARPRKRDADEVGEPAVREPDTATGAWSLLNTPPAAAPAGSAGWGRPAPAAEPMPAPEPAPVGARFYRERRSSRHRA